MAFQFNPQAYDRGAAIVGGYYAKERQDELDRQAAIDWQNKQVEFANRQTTFEQGQEDRSRLEGAYDQYGKIAPTTDAYGSQVEGFTRGLMLPSQRPVEPATPVDNPAVNNVMSQPGTGLPVGNFAGDPRKILAQLNSIPDPVERERAKAAYHLQLNDPERNAQLLQEERARLSGQVTPIAQGVAPARQPVPTVQAGQMEPAPAQATQGQGVAPPQAESPKQTDPVLAQLLQVRQALLNGPRSAQGLSKLMEVDTAINGRSLMNSAAEVGKQVSAIRDPQQRAAVVDNLFNKTMGLDAQTTADGYAVLRIADKTISISPQNMAYAAMGAFMMQHDPDKGFAMLTKADKELADYVKANNLVMAQYAGNVNQVQNYRNQDENRTTQLGIQERSGRARQLVQFQDKTTGEAVMLDVNSLPIDQQTGQVAVPKNLQPIRAKTDPQVKLQAASKLVSDGAAPNTNEAMLIVDRMYNEAPDPQATAAMVAKNLQAMRAQREEKPSPTGVRPPTSQLQQAYDAWQAAKGPWYMPTPAANAEVKALEQRYEQLLRQGVR